MSVLETSVMETQKWREEIRLILMEKEEGQA